MKLMTKEIETKLPPIYTNDNKKPEDTPIIVKFFCPWNSWTWYATEGERIEGGDMKFFGWVQGDFSEMGYFLLSELESVRGPVGLKIERDMYPRKLTLADVMKGQI